MERKTLSVLFTFLVLVTGMAAANTDFWQSDGASPIVATMSLDELVGQVLMLGYSGTYPADEFLEYVRKKSIGGVKIFGWNGHDLPELARSVGATQRQAALSRLRIPLFVATDQEGGWVQHVKGEMSQTPGNLAIGATRTALDAYETAVLIGRELSALGINMNFAPTVDVYTHPENQVIGPRAFSSDPVETAFLALAFFRGLEKAGVIATAKHYPGHGNTDKDSHGTLPVIRDTFETIWDRDLLPYRLLIKEGLPAIMSGHLSYPKIIGESIPATLSPFFGRTILRGTLGFEGLVITDDMRMYGALQSGYDIKEACKVALEAGNDIILISHDLPLQREIYDYLVAIAEESPAFKQVLIEAVSRIMKIKRRYFADRDPESLIPALDKIEQRIPDREGSSALFDLACRSITVVRPGSVPLSSANSILLVGQYESFFSEGLLRFKDAATFGISYYTTPQSRIDELRAAVEAVDRAVFCLANDSSLVVLESLEEYADKLTVFSVLTPIYLRHTPWVQSAIATYARGRESFQAGFAVLAGDYEPEGILPIPLTP